MTHLDALSHIFWDGRMYNGRPAATVTASMGATANDVTAARDGMFTRGVLLDVAAVRGVDWLEPGEAVYPDDLEAAEELAGLRVDQGDAVLVRTGHGRRRRELAPALPLVPESQAGLHAATLPWLHERGAAVVGCDTALEVVASGYPEIVLPVHAIGIVAMGLWSIDNCDLEQLAVTCAELRRWEFLLTAEPLPVVGSTGSPINPVAAF